jgi:hypothetical protein
MALVVEDRDDEVNEDVGDDDEASKFLKISDCYKIKLSTIFFFSYISHHHHHVRLLNHQHAMVKPT